MSMTWTREPDADKGLAVFDLGDVCRTTFQLWLTDIDLAFEIENMLLDTYQMGLLYGYRDATRVVHKALAEGKPL